MESEEGAREPDKVLTTGDVGQVAGEVVHRVERVAGAVLELKGLVGGVEFAHTCDESSHGSVVAAAVLQAVLVVGQAVLNAAFDEVLARKLLRVSGSLVKLRRKRPKMAMRVPGGVDLKVAGGT